MQSFDGDELLQTLRGEVDELIKSMPHDATHHVIGHLPKVGDDVTINGLIWIVARINDEAGWMRLTLKTPQ